MPDWRDLFNINEIGIIKILIYFKIIDATYSRGDVLYIELDIFFYICCLVITLKVSKEGNSETLFA